MHNAALQHGGINGVYVPFEVQPADIAAAVAGVRALGVRGVNVTVPHKEAVVPFLDALTPEAERALAEALAAAQAVPVKEIVAAGFKGEEIKEQLAKKRTDAISRIKDEWTFIEE